APVGPEFRVNTTTAEDQLAASVAVDADGDFIVAWESVGEYFSKGIYAQRYNAAGLAQGAQFRVDPADNNWDFYPSVACDAEGNFVVAWENRSGVGWGIYARRYNAAGVAQGGEFPVKKSTTAGDQHPSVASDADGDFVVAWGSRDQDGFGYGVYAQRYDSADVPQGGEFRVNTTTAGFYPSVASDAEGDVVVAWEGVYAHRYNAAGVAQG